MFGYEPEFVVCGDARIAYYDVGRGKPLVLLHGNGEDSSYWNAQIPELTRFYRVIAVDSRGHGASGSGEHGLSFEMMAEDLKTVLDTLGVKKAHFLGFSDGGNLAIKFALTHPEYIDKLISCDVGCSAFSRRCSCPLWQLRVAAALSRFSKKAARRRDVLGLMVHPYGVTMNDLERLTMPTLIIVGEHDAIREKQTKEMASHIPHCEVEVFRDGDHFVAAKQPSRFNRTVIEFLLGR
ncbi:MAG: alpha/beta fold hydrolase [Butyricicoccus sp.]